jgi:hypothetical protein
MGLSTTWKLIFFEISSSELILARMFSRFIWDNIAMSGNCSSMALRYFCSLVEISLELGYSRVKSKRDTDRDWLSSTTCFMP